jgi:hypothetical protein
MFSKAVAAVVPVTVYLSGIECRPGPFADRPASEGNPDSLLARSPAQDDHIESGAVSSGAFQHPTPHFTGRQRPDDFVTQSGDNNCANAVRNTGTTAAIVQPAA